MFLFLGARGERVQGRGHDPKKFGNQSFNLSIVFHIDYVPSFGGGGGGIGLRIGVTTPKLVWEPIE